MFGKVASRRQVEIKKGDAIDHEGQLRYSNYTSNQEKAAGSQNFGSRGDVDQQENPASQKCRNARCRGGIEH